MDGVRDRCDVFLFSAAGLAGAWVLGMRWHLHLGVDHKSCVRTKACQRQQLSQEQRRLVQMTTRTWIAQACYPGLKEFIAGTVFTDRESSEETARQMLYDHMLTFLPEGFEILAVMPGYVVVQYGADD